MKKVKDVVTRELKKACRALNNEEGLLETKIQYTGVKNQEMYDEFVKTIEGFTPTIQADLPEEVIDFYNSLIGDETDPPPKVAPVAVAPSPVVVIPPETTPTPKAPAPPTSASISSVLRIGGSAYKDFAEYVKVLEKKVTAGATFIDKILLKGVTLEDAVKKFEAFKIKNEVTHSGYNKPSAIRGHIKSREQRSNFIFKTDEQGVITLIGRTE